MFVSVVSPRVLVAFVALLAGGANTHHVGVVSRGTLVFTESVRVEGYDNISAVWTVRADGTGLRNPIEEDYGTPTSPRWSRDGAKIAFQAFDVHAGQLGASAVFVMNADGTRATSLFASEELCGKALAWSHDDSLFAVDRCAPYADPGSTTGWGIGIVTRTSRTYRSIVPQTGPLYLDWSPNNKRLAFSDSYGKLWLVNRDGSGLRRIVPALIAPRWSPDGRTLLGRGSSGLYTLSLNSLTRTRLVGMAGVTAQAWSPDGKQVAYTKKDGIHILDLASGRTRLLGTTRYLCGVGCDSLDWTRARR